MHYNTAKPPKIRITADEAAGQFVLDFDYNYDFITALKAEVPPSQRSYDPKTKLWRVDFSRKKDLFELAAAIFVGAIYEYRDTDTDALTTLNLKTGESTVTESLFAQEP